MPKKKKKQKAVAYFDSMKIAAKRLGVPYARIKQANQDACEAFRSGRVYKKELLKWLKENPESGQANGEVWSEVKIKWQAQREEIKFKKEKKLAVDFDKVKFALASGMAKMFSLMDRTFTVELPPALKGLDEIQIQRRCAEANEKFKLELRAALLALAEETHTPVTEHP